MAGADFENIGEAGEYVLGTLDAAERAAFEARLLNDTALQADALAWQRRLAPLERETLDAEPPVHMLTKILERIDAPVASNVVQLKRRVNVWRSAAIAMTGLAAALVLFVVVRGDWRPAPKGLYVAVLQSSDATPGFVAAVDVEHKVLVVRSIGAKTPAGHSLELWALGAGRSAPQPVGVINATAHISSDRLDNKPLDATMLAVSLEPEGGSPTGAPTGPVLFTGKLMAAE